VPHYYRSAVEATGRRLGQIGRLIGGGRQGTTVHRAALRLAAVFVRSAGGHVDSRIASFDLPASDHRVALIRTIDNVVERLRVAGIEVRVNEDVVPRASAANRTEWRDRYPDGPESGPDGMYLVELFVRPDEYWRASALVAEYMARLDSDTPPSGV
jgi:hypothetical protein